MSLRDDWIAELAGWADALDAAGVRATYDAGAIAPPCVYLAPRSIDFARTLGCASGELDLIAIVIGAPGDPSGITEGGLLELVEKAADVLPITRADRTTYTKPGADPLPAFTLT